MESDSPLIIEDRPGVKGPPPNKCYKTPAALLPALEASITEMLQKGWIQPSTSDYSSPVLIIKKPNGKGY
eukprot:SAG11_NODE_480_length_9107_cov_7.433171_1_plen_69_part_10